MQIFYKSSESFLVAIATKLTNTKKAAHTAQTGGSKMKGLVLTSVLFIGLSFQLLSHEETRVFYYQIPAQSSEVNFDVNTDACGGYVAQDFSDIFHVQNTNESESSDTTYKDTYYALGEASNSDSAI